MFISTSNALKCINTDDAGGQWYNLKASKEVYIWHPAVYKWERYPAGCGFWQKHISQFRFILGDDNTVVVDGITYPLKAPSGQQSGFKVNVDETLTDGVKDNNTVASSRPDKETGAFTINGLTPGHYKVLIDDSNGYKDKKFEDVEVLMQHVTATGTTFLQK